MKNVVFFIANFLYLSNLHSQNALCKECISNNFQYQIDTSGFFFTRQNLASLAIDTGLISNWKGYDFFCKDTLVVYLEYDPRPHTVGISVSVQKFENNAWQNGGGFYYVCDDWAMAGKFWPHKVYKRASDYKLLSINLFQWRETSMKGDRTGKEVWEYVDQLDFDTGEKVRVSSTRIE